ncbi:hypothetical protein GCM10008942_22890 [Rhizomicrobium electricum]|uniref:Uncharacterized protein n=1 Tax=Rhizomicrobium electricum TaxID=480070 RepID=A0ABP3PRP5_9PROT
MDTDLGPVSGTTFGLVLSEPIIGSVVDQHAAAVSIDRNTSGVVPDLARLESILRKRRTRRSHEQSRQHGGA